MPKLLTLFIALAFLFGCKKESIPAVQTSFPGYYKVTKMTSAAEVDLNNDGLKTNNIYLEISAPFTLLNGQQVSFYDFESPANYLEVRAPPTQINKTPQMAFNFPHQHIDSLSNHTPYLLWYTNEFLGYTYEFTGSNTVQVTSNNPDYTNMIGVISGLQIKENGDVIVSLQKQVFDFADGAWVNIDITTEYTKVP